MLIEKNSQKKKQVFFFFFFGGGGGVKVVETGERRKEKARKKLWRQNSVTRLQQLWLPQKHSHFCPLSCRSFFRLHSIFLRAHPVPHFVYDPCASIFVFLIVSFPFFFYWWKKKKKKKSFYLITAALAATAVSLKKWQIGGN